MFVVTISSSCYCEWYFLFFFPIFLLFLLTEGRQANAKAQEAGYHLASLCQLHRRFQSRESNRQPFPTSLKVTTQKISE